MLMAPGPVIIPPWLVTQWHSPSVSTLKSPQNDPRICPGLTRQPPWAIELFEKGVILEFVTCGWIGLGLPSAGERGRDRTGVLVNSQFWNCNLRAKFYFDLENTTIYLDRFFQQTFSQNWLTPSPTIITGQIIGLLPKYDWPGQSVLSYQGGD